MLHCASATSLHFGRKSISFYVIIINYGPAKVLVGNMISALSPGSATP